MMTESEIQLSDLNAAFKKSDAALQEKVTALEKKLQERDMKLQERDMAFDQRLADLEAKIEQANRDKTIFPE
jgi:cobalamin biosynthesis protein CobT